MRMPVMDGASLIQLIRPRRPDLPIIVMTGYSEAIPREEHDLLKVLRKPFRLESMVRAVQALLPKTPVAPSASRLATVRASER